MTNTLPRLFTLPNAQAELARLGAEVSIDTLRREIHRGHLRPTRIGRKLFIRDDHLQAYLEQQQDTSCPEKHDQGPSAATGSASAPTVKRGAAPGSIPLSDRQDAHRLAQMTFSKPS